ncbi:MAG: hypothetical protein NTX15_08225 [Candidatus Kapabacteria bacterium]|nr:hypothetical protein [Candidatus Kapabacteria bacterium]
MSEESMLPSSSKNAWKFVYGMFALLAITGLVLSLLYRDSTKPGEVIRKAQRKAATRVVYTIIYSRVSDSEADRVISAIAHDLGADTATADLIVGSPITDPWCASISEYKRNLRRAMTETKEIPIGKQSIIFSMVAGLLTKNELPARVYLVGRISGDDITAIALRTARTVSAIELRSNMMGVVDVISYLSPVDAPSNREYVRLFEGKAFKLEKPLTSQ